MSFWSPKHLTLARLGRGATAPRSTSRAQLAAVIALVAAVAVVWLAVSAVAEDLGALLVPIVCVFVVAFSGWFVLIRRGPARLLGVPGVLLGLTVFITFVGENWATLLVLIGVVALFSVAGRYAVGHDRATVHRVQQNARPVRPARRGVLIINPDSGGGKAERFNLPEEARKRGVEPLLLRRGDDLRELATRAVADGADVIGMAGGDGSQALVATVAMQHDVAHVCVPAGTLNHFALDLGLDRDDVVGALDAFTDGVERRIDLASVNNRIFVNNASLGVYAGVVQSSAYREAKLRTWRRMLPEMLGPTASSIDLQFEGPDASDWADPALVLVSNNPYRLRHLAGAGTRPRLDTGQLGILAARLRGARDLAKLATLSTLGQSQRFGGLLEWSCPAFEVRSGACVAVGLDGETLLLVPPLHFVSLPGALRVRLSRQAAGISPAGAAVTLTRQDFAALFRIAARRPGVPRTPEETQRGALR
jgi:diacylglycerol kinase family enzyme